jgi:fructose-1,6-bisphosphatase/inositol monophosphatase family enzyme
VHLEETCREGKLNYVTDLLAPLRDCAQAIGQAVTGRHRQGYSGQRETQYHLDLVADEIAVRILTGAGHQVISEESGVSGSGPYQVVVDPIDGSTNCDRGVPFFSTSLALMKGDELVGGVVRNQATGDLYEGLKGEGARLNGVPISSNGQIDPAQVLVAFSGFPEHRFTWFQNRGLGSAALEICLVAEGSLDVFSVAEQSTLNPWDYLAGLLIAREAGASDGEYDNLELVTSDSVKRRPVVASSPELVTFYKNEWPF